MKDATNAMRNLCDRRQNCDELITRRLFNRSKWLTNYWCPDEVNLYVYFDFKCESKKELCQYLDTLFIAES